MEEKPKKLRGVKAHVGLSKKQIVNKAIEIIEQRGLEGFNMRLLGKELGVDPMAIYRYLPSKSALFDSIDEFLMTKIEFKPGSWATLLRSTAYSYRDLAKKYPRTFPLLTMRPSFSVTGANLAEEMIVSLIKAGLTTTKANNCLRAFISFLNGYLLAEVEPSPSIEHPSEDEMKIQFNNLTAEGNYDHLAQFVTEDYGDEQIFAATLEITLIGIENQIKMADF